MRQYKTKEVFSVDKILCNKCGKVIAVENDIPKEDVLHVEKRWGFFSEKDNETHQFDLCEKCYDEFTATFTIPVEKEE